MSDEYKYRYIVDDSDKYQKHFITLFSFSSFQTPADTSNIHQKAKTGARIYGIKHTHTPTTHTADDSYKYHRTRVRSDSYSILL